MRRGTLKDLDICWLPPRELEKILSVLICHCKVCVEGPGVGLEGGQKWVLAVWTKDIAGSEMLQTERNRQGVGGVGRCQKWTRRSWDSSKMVISLKGHSRRYWLCLELGAFSLGLYMFFAVWVCVHVCVCFDLISFTFVISLLKMLSGSKSWLVVIVAWTC